MSELYSNSIFWIETEKIKPNPYQPRRDFEEGPLKDLADSIRQYGVLQPLVVTRREIDKPEGGLAVEYELIAGERRLRASKIAGLNQVPVVIRKEDDARTKLELAIIENLQRENLNPIDRARAFARLAEEFKMTHSEIGKKMGKSREYVSNSLRLLQLPEEMMDAVAEKRITEGHTRPLMMLSDRPLEQMTLFKEIVYKKMSVRDSEIVARKIAKDKIRKREVTDPKIIELEERFSENLGTRVHIEPRETGGKIVIDYFASEDLEMISALIQSNLEKSPTRMLKTHEERIANIQSRPFEIPVTFVADHADLPGLRPVEISVPHTPDLPVTSPEELLAPLSDEEKIESLDDQTPEEEKKIDQEVDDLYNVGKFTV